MQELLRSVDQGSDLEADRRRVALIEEMLQRLGPVQYPAFRATLQVNLGNIYLRLPVGDRTSNLGKAIACYERALRFYTPEAAPLDYARTQTNLSQAYADLPTGDRAANLRKAIACYREALRFRTPEAAPLDYAGTQNNLGNAYLQLPVGDRAANLQKAIDCYEQALRVFTPEAGPLHYARTQNNLGAAYGDFPVGDRAANLRQAIACYEQALRFRTFKAAPFDYAMIQNNLGNAYLQLPVEDRAVNLEKAIDCYEQALRVFTPEAAPFDYARTQTNLGIAYADLPVGDRAANLRQAIACYEQALLVYTPETGPLHYATTQNNLGTAYADLPVGDRAANLRQAIVCYEQALRFRTLKDAPLDYAGTQNNLGIAYADLPVGDRAANLQKAIACYEQALLVYTPEADPLHYATTQTNLGIAYADLPVGDRAANLQKAIACYEQALRVYTPEAAPHDYARTQMNLGGAYANLPVGDRAANLQKAIACYEQALRFRTFKAAPLDYAWTQNNLGVAYAQLPVGDRAANLRQAIVCYDQALRFRTLKDAPHEYAGTQNNLGIAYADLPVGDRAANLQQAIACYEQALRVYTPEAAPDGCRKAAHGLGDLYFGESQWSQAKASYTTAIKATDALYKVAATEVSRQAELAEARDLFSNLAFCLAQLGEFNEAIEQLEAGKARGLAEALARDRAVLDGVRPEDQAVFEAARSRIKSLQAEARSIAPKAGSDHTTSRSFPEISDDLSAAYHDLESVANHIRTYQPNFMPQKLDFEAIAATVMPECPLVYLITTSQGSLAFLIPPGAKTLDTNHVVRLDEFHSDDLDGLLLQRDTEGEVIGGYLVGQVGGEYPQLQAGLDLALPVLRDRLMGPLSARLVELGFRRASLIPGGRLSLLPLHAAGFDAVTFTYTPSARALRAARGAARERAKGTPMFLGIGNPLPNRKPLAFARTEVEEIALRFALGSQLLLIERKATLAETKKALPGATHLHFSCHGTFDVREPLDSALFLSGDDKLTLRDLLDGGLDLSAARLAVLSACQTGIVDFDKIPDEAIGFPAGFMQAGVPGVVSTLWPVDAISTALLLARFYRCYLVDGTTPAAALHQAQVWLRDATAAELRLADYYERQFRASGRRDKPAYDAAHHYRHNPAAKPFAHPYHWAAFTFSGV